MNKCIILFIVFLYSGIAASSSIDSSLVFDNAKALIEEYSKIPDKSKKEKAALAYKIGFLLKYTSKSKEALKYFSIAESFFSAINDSLNKAWCFYHTANIFSFTGNYIKSLELCVKADVIAKEKKYLLLEGYCANLHARLYYLQRNEEKSFELHSNAYALAVKINNKELIADALTYLGIVWRNRDSLNKALHLFEQSLQYRNEIRDEDGKAWSLLNIGIIYAAFRNETEALRYYLMADSIWSRSFNAFNLTQCYSYIAKAYLKSGNNKLAEEYFEKSLELALLINDKKLIRYNYYDLSVIAASKSDYKRAFQLVRLYSVYKDSIVLDQGLLDIARVEAKSETEKNEREILFLNETNKLKESELNKSRIINISIVGILVLALALIFYVIKNLNEKKKSNQLLEEKNKLISEKSNNILDSINYAKGIQEAILPDISKIAAAVPEFFIFYQPKDIVSGDFYWFNKINNKVLIAAADCTGHGVPGALMSLISSQSLHQAVNELNINSPGEILDFANSKIKEVLTKRKLHNKTIDGMDIALCSIDFNASEVTFAGANNPLWIVRAKNSIEIKADKQSIGAADKHFKNNTVTVSKNDMLYIFTDGYKDQFGGLNKKKLMSKRFKEMLINISEMPVHDQEKYVCDYFNDWKGALDQVDDVCLIGIKI